jgi:hypothetical protein
MTYDSLTGKAILYGEDVGLWSDANDKWEYDGFTWDKKSALSAPPGNRGSSAIRGMVYDSARDRIVLMLRRQPVQKNVQAHGRLPYLPTEHRIVCLFSLRFLLSISFHL